MSTEVTTDEIATGWMAGMVTSLADNKAALGRRYSDWAVSAPTLESAVAAAAMAQDELGHARSTYPVLKSLGIGAREDDSGFGGSHRFACLDDEFTTWNQFVAANVVIDGVLATFVAACEDSSVQQLSQRARKILQEEGSHRIHGESWARRLSRGSARDDFREQVRLNWAEASPWFGPDDDAGAEAALDTGMMRVSAARQREQVRSWLDDLFRSCDINLDLPDEPSWQQWDPVTRRIAS